MSQVQTFKNKEIVFTVKARIPLTKIGLVHNIGIEDSWPFNISPEFASLTISHDNCGIEFVSDKYGLLNLVPSVRLPDSEQIAVDSFKIMYNIQEDRKDVLDIEAQGWFHLDEEFEINENRLIINGKLIELGLLIEKFSPLNQWQEATKLDITEVFGKDMLERTLTISANPD